MKKFLVQGILFLLPLTIVILFIEIKLSVNPTTYEFKRKHFEAQLEDIEVIILGNSQSFSGVNPDHFSLKGFNLCNGSQTLYYDTEIALKYLTKMPKLQYALINVSHFSFWYILEDSHEPWRKNFYYKYWDIEPEEAPISFISKYSNLSRYSIQTTFEIITNGNQKETFNRIYKKNGWGINDTVWICKKNKEEALGRIAHFRKRYLNENRIEKNIQTIEKLLSSLKKEDIKPIFFSTPLTKIYASLIAPEIVNTNAEILAKLCEYYDCNYYDYTYDRRFVKSDFIDVNHLNFIGAEKFSKIIDKEILKTGEVTSN